MPRYSSKPDGESKQAVVTDIDGDALTQTTLKIELSNRDRLIVSRGRPAFLQLDFDLGASHSVDIGKTPAEAVSEQFIVAEVAPVDEKDIRVRGPLDRSQCRRNDVHHCDSAVS